MTKPDITTTKIPPRTCTIGPSAVTGERCGKPAVAWFIGGGKVYAECAEHLTPGYRAELRVGGLHLV